MTFGCSSFRLAHVISLVLDFKIFSEPRTLLKDIPTKKLSEKTSEKSENIPPLSFHKN